MPYSIVVREGNVGFGRSVAVDGRSEWPRRREALRAVKAYLRFFPQHRNRLWLNYFCTRKIRLGNLPSVKMVVFRKEE